MTWPFGDIPRAHFAALMVDPPWHFRARTALQVGNWTSRRDAEKHYGVMGVDDIKALPVGDLAAKDAHLFLWTTGPCLRQSFEVMEAWGFRYSAVAFTWIKLKKSFNAMQLRVVPTLESDLHVGLGLTTRKNAEFCLLARRGNARRIAKDVREIILAPVREPFPQAGRSRRLHRALLRRALSRIVCPSIASGMDVVGQRNIQVRRSRIGGTMARGKRAETNATTSPKAKAKAADAKPGHNSSALTDDERQALHWRHMREYEGGLALKKDADAKFKNICKRVHAEGGSINAIKLSIALRTPEGEAAFRSRLAEENEVAQWNGVGVQVDLFADSGQPSEERAEAEGKRAGLQGDPRRPPHDPSVPQYAAWMKGFDQGQQVLASEGFKRLTPVEQAAAA